MQNKQTDRQPESESETEEGDNRVGSHKEGRQSATCKVDNKNKLLPLCKDNNDSSKDNYNNNNNYNDSDNKLDHGQDGSSVITQPIGLLSDFPISLSSQLDINCSFSWVQLESSLYL
ncbi:hypothetical protein ACLKA7_013201 [Drosophila subpalustris]